MASRGQARGPVEREPPRVAQRTGARPGGGAGGGMLLGRAPFHLEIDDSGGTVRNMTLYVQEILGFGFAYEAEVVTGVDDSGERVVKGVETSLLLVIKGRYSDTATTGSDAVLSGLPGVIGTISYGPVGNKTGQRKFSGEYLCTLYTVDSLLAGGTVFEARFRQDGVVTVGTW